MLDEVIFGRCRDAELQLHLIECPRCTEYFRNYQVTVSNIRAVFSHAERLSKPVLTPPVLTPQEIRTVLINRGKETSARTKEASRIFDEIMRTIPSGIPHPDGGCRWGSCA